MKQIIITDQEQALNAEKVAQVQAVANAASVQHQQGADWRPAAARALAAVFPTGWTYTGGRHIAQHASPPRPQFNKIGDQKPGTSEAGTRLFILAEAKG